MSVYIFKNNQQSGPFEENAILDWLKNGQLSIEDLACRKGANEWQKLKALFPSAASAEAPVLPASKTAGEKVEETPVCRKTMFQKIVFGGIIVLLFLAFFAALQNLWAFSISSGDLETDLQTLPFRAVARNAAITILIALFLAVAAFLLSFKKRIIQTYGVRMALRVFFIFFIFSAIIQAGFAAYHYQNYYPPSSKRLLMEDKKSSPFKKLQELSEIEAARSSVLAINLPIAFGLLVLGAAGFSMTQFKTSEEM